MADNETPGDGEKRITLPERVLRDYIKQMNESVGKIKEELKKGDAKRDDKIKALEKKTTQLEEKPLGRYVEGWTAQMVEKFQTKIRDGTVGKVLEAILGDIVPRYIANQLPGAIQKERGLIADLTRKQIEEQASDIIERMIAKKEPEIEQIIANGINKIDGAQPATVEETIERKRKRKKYIRWRNRILGTVAAAIVLGGPAIAIWYSSKRTAEGARGVANRALQITEGFDKQINGYKQETTGWQKRHDLAESIENEKRRKEMTGLEKRLADQINTRATTAGLADIEKRLIGIGADIEAERKKGREEKKAYEEFKKFTDTISKGLYEIQKRFGELEGRVADRSAADRLYVNCEIAQVRALYENLSTELTKYDAMLTDYGDSLKRAGEADTAILEEIKKLGANYSGFVTNYNTLTERVKKLEDGQTKKEEK